MPGDEAQPPVLETRARTRCFGSLMAVNSLTRSVSAGEIFGLFGAAFFATFSLIIASLVKTRERFMGIGQVLTMQLFFASNAIDPLAMLPSWLLAISRLNPRIYEVEALLLAQGHRTFGVPLDVALLLQSTRVAVAVGAWLFPRIIT